MLTTPIYIPRVTSPHLSYTIFPVSRSLYVYICLQGVCPHEKIYFRYILQPHAHPILHYVCLMPERNGRLSSIRVPSSSGATSAFTNDVWLERSEVTDSFRPLTEPEIKHNSGKLSRSETAPLWPAENSDHSDKRQRQDGLSCSVCDSGTGLHGSSA